MLVRVLAVLWKPEGMRMGFAGLLWGVLFI